MSTRTFRPLRNLVLLLAGAFAAGACDRMPTSPDVKRDELAPRFSAQRAVLDGFYELDDSSYPFQCSADGEYLPDGGELVAMHGKLYWKIAEMLDGAGNLHLRIHTMPVGMGGVSELTGEAFRVSESDHSSWNLGAATAGGTFRSRRTMVGLETGRRMTLVFGGHIRVTANGAVELVKDQVVTECR